jgi:hypothetical protein
MLSIAAPGMTSVTVKSWKQGGALGADSTVGTITLDAEGKGTLLFPAHDYPHGPISVRLYATGDANAADTAYLQLYNQGGVRWNEGLASAPTPPQAEGMSVVFQDDFETLPTMSGNGDGATYATHKPDYKDFSVVPFVDPTPDAKNPFSQVDTYLRIRGNDNPDVNSTGILSSLRADNTGFKVMAPFYMECRFIAQSAIGTWPAFWTATAPATGPLDAQRPADELDVIEGYGGEGQGTPNDPFGYMVTSHTWNYTGTDGVYNRIAMDQIGGKGGWTFTPHTYGVLVTATYTYYFLDNTQVIFHATQQASKDDPTFFMIDFAVGGGGWKEDLSRYNGIADMYVDWVRVFH